MMNFLLFAFLGFAQAEEALYITSNVTLKVLKKEQVADSLVLKAEELNGYYSSRTDYGLQLKIPVAQVEAYLDFVTEQGLIASRSFNSQSLSQGIADLSARLKTREELLQKYFSILEEAESDHVIAVENEVIRLISEIESLKGQLHKQMHLAKYADIYIEFRFRDRRAPVSDGSSSFSWINTLNITDLLSAFQYGWEAGAKKSAGEIPEGFASYSETKKDIKASSHDGVFYRVRTLKPNPSANDAFWAEAVAKRMSEAGYHPAGEQEQISATQIGAGHLIQVLAPNGAEDMSYWIAFHQVGKKLVVVEVLGEVSTFEPRTDAIMKAIEDSLAE